MRNNIEWLIGQYTDKIEELEREKKTQKFGITFICGQIWAYSEVVEDLRSILEESEGK